MRNLGFASMAIIACLCAASHAASEAFVYDAGVYTMISPPGAVDVRATSINNLGVVAGYGFFSADPFESQGFIDYNGSYSIFGIPGASSINLLSINNSGEVAGLFSNGSNYEGFAGYPGSYVTVQPPGAVSSGLVSINNSGAVAGVFSDGTIEHSFVESGGIYTTIDFPGAADTYIVGMNDDGEIAGTFTTTPQSSTRGSFVELNGMYSAIVAPGSETSVSAINNLGVVAGTFVDGLTAKGFIDDGGVFTIISVPGSGGTWINAINDFDVVAGLFESGSHVLGFIESGGIYTILKPAGAVDSNVFAINDSGEVTGDFEIQAVPEPAAWLEVLLGLTGTGAVLRRRSDVGGAFRQRHRRWNICSLIKRYLTRVCEFPVRIGRPLSLKNYFTPQAVT